MVVVAAMTVMLIGATTFATDSAFADKKKKSYEKSQAVSQVNDCGNGWWPENVGCQNTASQIQGDDNSGSTSIIARVRRRRLRNILSLQLVQSNHFFLNSVISNNTFILSI